MADWNIFDKNGKHIDTATCVYDAIDKLQMLCDTEEIRLDFRTGEAFDITES